MCTGLRSPLCSGESSWPWGADLSCPCRPRCRSAGVGGVGGAVMAVSILRKVPLWVTLPPAHPLPKVENKDRKCAAATCVLCWPKPRLGGAGPRIWQVPHRTKRI